MDKATIREIQAIRLAEEEVAPYAGPVLGMDSAGAVYRTALERMGHDVSNVPVHAVTQGVFQAMKSYKGRSRSMAQDSAARADFDKRFPHANRLNRGY
jgi:hypothetical protein